VKRRLVVRPLAKSDLDEQARYIAHDNVEAALRFLEAAEAAFDRLRSLPEVGKIRKFQHPGLAGVRSWLLPGFERHSIFYRMDSAKVDILHIIHTARDLAGIFGPEDS
jgi:plasmid stabilization system protein ParE